VIGYHPRSKETCPCVTQYRCDTDRLCALSAGATGVVAYLEVISPDEVGRTRSVVEYAAAAADVGLVAMATNTRLVVAVRHVVTTAYTLASSAVARTPMMMMMMMTSDVIRTL